jgi:hypothetical protein
MESSVRLGPRQAEGQDVSRIVIFCQELRLCRRRGEPHSVLARTFNINTGTACWELATLFMHPPHTWEPSQCTKVACSIRKTCEHGLQGSDTGLTTDRYSKTITQGAAARWLFYFDGHILCVNSYISVLIIHILVAFALRVFAVTPFVNIQHFLL